MLLIIFVFWGVTLDSNLTFINHANNLSSEISPIIGILNRNKRNYTTKIRLMLYKSILLPKITYALTCWYTDRNNIKTIINKLHKRCLRTLTTHWTRSACILKKFGLWSIHQQYLYNINKQTKQIVEFNVNHPIHDYISQRNCTYIRLNMPKVTTSGYKKSTLYRRIKCFNNLPKSVLCNRKTNIESFNRILCKIIDKG